MCADTTEAARDEAALISMVSRRAGKTRFTMYRILERHSTLTHEEIISLMEEIFDNGPVA